MAYIESSPSGSSVPLPAQGEPGSFRDPGGFVYRRGSVLYRQINRGTAQESYETLMRSGLYDTLVQQRLLIPHEGVSNEERFSDSAFAVIKPRPVPFVSYPYEWCFGQLKDAALLTLRLQREAVKAGMSLKDASAYNVQFVDGAQPVFIDTLSFEPRRDNAPWVAYRQFCQHFLTPLALMAHVDTRLASLLRTNQDGIPIDIAAKLLPAQDRLSLPLLTHVFLHSAFQKRHSDTSMSESTSTAAMGENALLGLIDNLEGAIRGLKWEPQGTEWADYYDNTNYEGSALGAKETLVAQFLERIRPTPQRVCDLGANTGRFSRLASSKAIFTLALDIDPGAVEKNYRACRSASEKNLLPLVQNLADPSPGVGWASEERASFVDRLSRTTDADAPDAAFALALIHHIAISNNVPLPRIAREMSRFAEYLIIEWVPKEDGQVQRLLRRREDVFPDYTASGFEVAFDLHYHRLHSQNIPGTQRTLYLMRRKGTL